MKIQIVTILLFFAFCLNAQDDIPGYTVLQDIDGRVRSLQEGTDGTYYAIYSASYTNGVQNDTVFINSPDNYVVLHDGIIEDSIPLRRYKVVKFNSDDEIVAQQDIYSYIIADIGHMRVDHDYLIVEVEDVKGLYIGDEYTPYLEEQNRYGQCFVVLDFDDLSYHSHVTVTSDRNIGLQNWNVNEGSLYVMNEARHYVSVNEDSMRIEHPGYDREWINLIRYDYINSELLWSKLLHYGLIETGLEFPQHFGVDIGDDGLIYTSGGDYGVPTYFLGDTLNEVVDGVWIDPFFLDGVVMVISPDGDFVDYYEVEGNVFIIDVKTIGDYAYLLMQGRGQTFSYKGHELDMMFPDSYNNVNAVIKVDRDGEYVNHWSPNTDCSVRYNYMRTSKDDELILFGKYSAPDLGCSNTTSEGIPFVTDDNGSILTLDHNLEVLENKIFSEYNGRSIPLDIFISENTSLVSYDINSLMNISDVIDVTEDIEYIFPEDNVIVPNPVSDLFIIRDNAKVTKFYILNMQGQQLQESDYRQGQEIDISAYQTGTYFIKLFTQNKIITKKIIKL